MRVCNVCLTHDPAYGGLHRSVVDFARALSGSILSFDDGHGERISVEDGTSVRRIGYGPGWLARDCRVMSAAVTCQADAAVAAADLLVVHSLFRAHAIPGGSPSVGCSSGSGLRRGAGRIWLTPIESSSRRSGA